MGLLVLVVREYWNRLIALRHVDYIVSNHIAKHLTGNMADARQLVLVVVKSERALHSALLRRI